MALGMSYPKSRDVMYKYFPILRTDNATPKCVLPKGATVVDLEVVQTTNATTGAGAVSLGYAGVANAFLNAFSLATTAVGNVKPGVAIGSVFGQLLTTDITVLSTYAVGTSTAGGEGWVKLGFVHTGPQEGIYN
jgi:hypothetical protein